MQTIFFIPFLSALPFLSLAGIAIYVLYSYSLYGMAEHTGIPSPWLAWIPVVRYFILGKLADRYNASFGKNSIYRFLIPSLHIAGFILAIDLFWSIVLSIWQYDRYFLSMLPIALFVCLCGAIALRIVQCICCYKVFCDYEPMCSVVYTILAVFQLEWIGLFLSRNNVPVGIAGVCQPRQPRYHMNETNPSSHI